MINKIIILYLLVHIAFLVLGNFLANSCCLSLHSRSKSKRFTKIHRGYTDHTGIVKFSFFSNPRGYQEELLSIPSVFCKSTGTYLIFPRNKVAIDGEGTSQTHSQ